MTKRLARLAALALVSWLTGCDENTCMQRGTTSHYSGTASYDATLAAGGSGAGTGMLEESVAVDDFAPWSLPPAPSVFVGAKCQEHGQEFTLHVGACQLWAHETSTNYSGAGTRYDPSVFDAASAEIEPGQSCRLRLQGGSADVVITKGALAVSETRLELTLSATFTSLPGVGPSSGTVLYQLTAL